MQHQIKFVSAHDEPLFNMTPRRHDDISGTLSFFNSTQAKESRTKTVQMIQTYRLTDSEFNKVLNYFEKPQTKKRQRKDVSEKKDVSDVAIDQHVVNELKEEVDDSASKT